MVAAERGFQPEDPVDDKLLERSVQIGKVMMPEFATDRFEDLSEQMARVLANPEARQQYFYEATLVKTAQILKDALEEHGEA